MANQTVAANAAPTTPALEVGKFYNVTVTGFTYIKDWAAVRGTIGTENVTVIIGDKMSFGMSDMFQLKHAGGIRAKYSKDKEVNGVSYRQFQLEEILF
jgi:hypothetical protein